MSHILNTKRFPREAGNIESTVVWSNEKFTFYNVMSTNDEGTIRNKGFLQRNIHKDDSVDAVLVFARIKIDGKNYFILTRQWREATGQYCIDAPAGVYEPDIDQNAQDAGLRELREETPLNATVVYESIVAYSSGGCISETIKVIVVNACGKDDQVKFEHGIVTGPTKFDAGENIMTLYVPVNGLYEQLKSLQEESHAIDARLMTWALSSYVSTMEL